MHRHSLVAVEEPCSTSDHNDDTRSETRTPTEKNVHVLEELASWDEVLESTALYAVQRPSRSPALQKGGGNPL